MKGRLQVSNPPSGFTITFDKQADDFLGGYWTSIGVTALTKGNGEVDVKVRRDDKSRHKIVKRGSANRFAVTRMVDRFGELEMYFPEEFGPTSIEYTARDGTLYFTVPRLSRLRAPIARMRNQTRKPLLNLEESFLPETDETILTLVKHLLDRDEGLRLEIENYLLKDKNSKGKKSANNLHA